jgi:hypothetical protein
MRQPPNPNPISQWVAPAARVATIACGWVVLAYAVALTLEILGRKFFNTSFKGIDELGRLCAGYQCGHWCVLRHGAAQPHPR